MDANARGHIPTETSGRLNEGCHVGERGVPCGVRLKVCHRVTVEIGLASFPIAVKLLVKTAHTSFGIPVPVGRAFHARGHLVRHSLAGRGSMEGSTRAATVIE